MMTDEQVRTLLDSVPASHRPAIFQALTGGDPSKTPMPCERVGCDRVVALEATYSPALFLRHTGRADVPSHVCDESAHGQHYYCSLECAEAGVLACWHGHIKPKLARLHAEAMAAHENPDASASA